jgi:hypothetical protein
MHYGGWAMCGDVLALVYTMLQNVHKSAVSTTKEFARRNGVKQYYAEAMDHPTTLSENISTFKM